MKLYLTPVVNLRAFNSSGHRATPFLYTASLPRLNKGHCNWSSTLEVSFWVLPFFPKSCEASYPALLCQVFVCVCVWGEGGACVCVHTCICSHCVPTLWRSRALLTSCMKSKSLFSWENLCQLCPELLGHLVTNFLSFLICFVLISSNAAWLLRPSLGTMLRNTDINPHVKNTYYLIIFAVP